MEDVADVAGNFGGRFVVALRIFGGVRGCAYADCRRGLVRCKYRRNMRRALAAGNKTAVVPSHCPRRD